MASQSEAPIEIQPLGEHHPREAFSCDHEPISDYFRARALSEHDAYKVRIRIAVRAGCDQPLGFCSLAIGALAPKTIKGKLGRKFGNWPIPVVYLAAIAVQSEECRQGIGALLMLDAFERAAKIADMAGTGCMTLDAVNEEKALWYEGKQFVRFGEKPDGRIQMFLPLQTIIDGLYS